MNKVRIKFEKLDGSGLIKLEGYAFEFPEEGKDFSIQVFKRFAKIIVDFGKVLNVKSLGELFLVQTELTILEVLFVGDNKNPKELTNLLDLLTHYNNTEPGMITIKPIDDEREPETKRNLKIIKNEETTC